MFYVREADIYLLALVSDVAKAILVDFQVSEGLFGNEVRPDDQVLKLLPASRLQRDQRLKRLAVLSCLNFRLGFLLLDKLQAFFDLSRGDRKPVVGRAGFCLHGEFLDPQVVVGFHGRVVHRGRLTHVEVDPQEGPLALNRI